MKKLVIATFISMLLASCSSSKIKVHNDKILLDLFIRQGEVFLNGEFDKSFSAEGIQGDSFYLIGVSSEPYSLYQNYTLANAEKNVREKLLDFVANDSKNKTITFIDYDRNFSKTSSVIESWSSVKGVAFTSFEKQSECHIKQRPRLDLTMEMLTECRVRYKFPLKIEGVYYDDKN
jgi:hypothetical protein